MHGLRRVGGCFFNIWSECECMWVWVCVCLCCTGASIGGVCVCVQPDSNPPVVLCLLRECRFPLGLPFDDSCFLLHTRPRTQHGVLPRFPSPRPCHYSWPPPHPRITTAARQGAATAVVIAAVVVVVVAVGPRRVAAAAVARGRWVDGTTTTTTTTTTIAITPGVHWVVGLVWVRLVVVVGLGLLAALLWRVDEAGSG